MISIRSRYIRFLVNSHDPSINPPIHPITHQTIHKLMGQEISTDYKSSNRIDIYLDSFKFYCNFRHLGPLALGEGAGGLGVSGSMGLSPHACTHMCMHAHMHMHMLNMLINMIPMKVAICNFFTYMYILACTCVCVHACMHICMWGHPHIPRYPLPSCSSPRTTGGPNQCKSNKTWTNQDNSIPFEDLGPLQFSGLI